MKAHELKRVYCMTFKGYHVIAACITRLDGYSTRLPYADYYLFTKGICKTEPKNVQAADLKSTPALTPNPGTNEHTSPVQQPNRIIHCLSKLFKKRCCQ